MDQPIDQYLSENLQKGYPVNQVIAALSAKGWTQEQIASALSRAAGAPAIAENAPGSPGDWQAFQKVLEVQNVRLMNLERRLNVSPVQTRETLRASNPQDAAAAVKEPEAMETKVTGTWFALIGIAAVVLGIGFFLKYAFDNNIIGVTGRVILGYLAGTTLLVLSLRLYSKERFQQYSLILIGGGLTLLYLSTYAAFSTYAIMPQPLAALVMVGITVLGVVLSFRLSSELVAGLALIGGCATPWLLSTGQNQALTLFGYVFLLDMGFLVVSYLKRWRDLPLAAFMGTYVVYLFWHFAHYDPSQLTLAFWFLTAVFSMFFLVPLLIRIAARSSADVRDVSFSTMNAAVYFTLGYTLLQPGHHESVSIYFAFGAGIYLVLAYLLWRYHPADRLLAFTHAALGLSLVVLLIPMELSGGWIAIAWTVLGSVLLYGGFWLSSYEVRSYACIVLTLASVRALVFDTGRIDPQTYLPFANMRFMVYMVVVLALALAARWYRVYQERLTANEATLGRLAGLMANAGALLALSLEVNTYFKLRTQNVYGFYDEYSFSRNARNLSLSLLWALYASGLTAAGAVRHNRSIRLFGLLLFAVVIVKVFLYDSAALADVYRIISFISLGVILLVVSYGFYRYKDRIRELLT